MQPFKSRCKSRQGTISISLERVQQEWNDILNFIYIYIYIYSPELQFRHSNGLDFYLLVQNMVTDRLKCISSSFLKCVILFVYIMSRILLEIGWKFLLRKISIFTRWFPYFILWHFKFWMNILYVIKSPQLTSKNKLPV